MGAQLSGLKPTHPGELLREIVFPALKRPKREIADLLGISRQMLHGILAERHPITPTMALRIGKLQGTSPESWLRMQEACDLRKAEQTMRKELKAIPTLRTEATEQA
jgi:antitoxin HigA-1